MEVGKERDAFREDPAIPLNGPEDAREQESGGNRPEPSSATTSLQPLIVGFSLHPRGKMNLYPTIYRSELSLRNRTGKIAGQNVRRK